jgi:hypothetical protein
MASVVACLFQLVVQDYGIIPISNSEITGGGYALRGTCCLTARQQICF